MNILNQPRRQVAYKVWISNLTNNEFIHKQGEWEPNYVQIKDKKVSRVNLIVTVIDKIKSDDGSYSSLIVDDGSDSISIKAWREDTKLFENIEIGTPVLIIGRVREYNGKVFIGPEIVRTLDNISWIELRKKELFKEYGQNYNMHEKKITEERNLQETSNSSIFEEDLIEESSSESERQKILNLIEKLEGEEGLPIETIMSKLNLDESKVKIVTQELLKEGEIFEIRPGRVKVIE